LGNTSEQLWVVIVNKVIEGPFSEDQLREMITSHAMSSTDFACHIAAKDHSSEWKFLWQVLDLPAPDSLSLNGEKIFPLGTTAAGPVADADPEVEVPMDPEEKQRFREELDKIGLSDLVPKHDQEFKMREPEEVPHVPSAATPTWRYVSGIAVSLIVGVVVIKTLLSFFNSSASETINAGHIEPPQISNPGNANPNNNNGSANRSVSSSSEIRAGAQMPENRNTQRLALPPPPNEVPRDENADNGAGEADRAPESGNDAENAEPPPPGEGESEAEAQAVDRPAFPERENRPRLPGSGPEYPPRPRNVPAAPED
jgi:hypothetical protein